MQLDDPLVVPAPEPLAYNLWALSGDRDADDAGHAAPLLMSSWDVDDDDRLAADETGRDRGGPSSLSHSQIQAEAPKAEAGRQSLYFSAHNGNLEERERSVRISLPRERKSNEIVSGNRLSLSPTSQSRILIGEAPKSGLLQGSARTDPEPSLRRLLDRRQTLGCPSRIEFGLSGYDREIVSGNFSETHNAPREDAHTSPSACRSTICDGEAGSFLQRLEAREGRGREERSTRLRAGQMLERIIEDEELGHHQTSKQLPVPAAAGGTKGGREETKVLLLPQQEVMPTMSKSLSPVSSPSCSSASARSPSTSIEQLRLSRRPSLSSVPATKAGVLADAQTGAVRSTQQPDATSTPREAATPIHRTWERSHGNDDAKDDSADSDNKDDGDTEKDELSDTDLLAAVGFRSKQKGCYIAPVTEKEIETLSFAVLFDANNRACLGNVKNLTDLDDIKLSLMSPQDPAVLSLICDKCNVHFGGDFFSKLQYLETSAVASDPFLSQLIALLKRAALILTAPPNIVYSDVNADMNTEVTYRAYLVRRAVNNFMSKHQPEAAHVRHTRRGVGGRTGQMAPLHRRYQRHQSLLSGRGSLNPFLLRSVGRQAGQTCIAPETQREGKGVGRRPASWHDWIITFFDSIQSCLLLKSPYFG